MSAASVTEICNMALTKVGHQQITSFDSDASKAGDLCRLHYPRLRNSILRAHPWNFAIKRVALASTGTTPAFEFDYQFALPTDCLKVIRTNWEATGYVSTAIYGYPGIMNDWVQPIPYRIEGRYLVCNETTVSIEYIAEITDVAQFDELFTEALAARLGAEIAVPLGASPKTAEYAMSVYNAKLSEARVVDAQEGSPREIVDVSPWIVTRT